MAARPSRIKRGITHGPNRESSLTPKLDINPGGSFACIAVDIEHPSAHRGNDARAFIEQYRPKMRRDVGRPESHLRRKRCARRSCVAVIGRFGDYGSIPAARWSAFATHSGGFTSHVAQPMRRSTQRCQHGLSAHVCQSNTIYRSRVLAKVQMQPISTEENCRSLWDRTHALICLLR